jgi:hypothetical protein
MPLGSADIAPFHCYYGLLPPDLEGHFLPSSCIRFYSLSLSGFRCSMSPSLSYVALAPIYDPPTIPSPTVGGLGTPVVWATGETVEKISSTVSIGPVATGECLSVFSFLRAVHTMVPGWWAWPLCDPPTYSFPWGLLPVGNFRPPLPSFIPPNNSIQAHIGVSGWDCQPSIQTGTSPVSSDS